MKIVSELPAVNVAEGGSASIAPAPQASVSEKTSSSPAAQSPASPQGEAAIADQARTSQELNLSFRKDWDGRTYYVVTNAQSGQIVREIPPEEMRQVSRGVEEYLKSQASSANPKIDTKA
jgi:uncharacterized FlaG/YvyC family protein